MTKGLKRILSMVIAIVMVVGMVPTNALHVHAAEGYDHHPDDDTKVGTVTGNPEIQPTGSKPDGTEWIKADPFQSKTCEKPENHVHTFENCYDNNCLHTGLGLTHDANCVPNAEVCSAKIWESCSHSAHYRSGSTRYGGSCNHECSESSGCRIRKCNIEENHTHSDANKCYTYTWTLVWKTYNVNVSTNAVDSEGNPVNDFATVAAISGATNVKHNNSFTVTAPKVEFFTPVVSYNGNQYSMTEGDKSYTVSIPAVADGTAVVTYTMAEKHTVTLVVNGGEYGEASLSAQGSLPEDTKVTITTNITAADSDAAKHSVAITVKDVDGNDVAVSDNIFTVGEKDITVTVTFSKKAIAVNSGIGDVEFNPSETAADQLATLKNAIFDAVVNSGASIPDSVTVDDVKIEYAPWYQIYAGGYGVGADLSGNSTGYISTLLEIGVTTESKGLKDDLEGTYTRVYYNFGERFKTADKETDNDAAEWVRITGKDGTSWAGLYVEAEINLTHTHNYGSVVTPPTCTADGFTTHTCSICGHNYADATVAASGHSYVDHEGQTATCTAEGWEAYQTCARCDYNSKVVIPATKHQNTLVQVDAKTPTCTDKGWDAYEYCTACDHTTYVEKPALNHSYGEWYTVQGSTSCTGSTERRDCQNVGCSHYETKDGNGSGHTMGEWNVTTPASCGQAGEERRDCANCDYFETQAITALTHDIKTVEAKSPTCTEIGWDAYEYCDRKDCDHTTYVEKAKLGHGHTAGYRNDNKQNGTHDVFCLDCNTVTNNVPHAFNAEHKCVCGAVETFTITFKNWNGDVIWIGAVEYGTKPAEPTGFTVPTNHSFAGWDDEVVKVAGAATYTAKVAMVNNATGDVFINGSLTNIADKISGLKDKVLKAAFGAGNYNADEYTVYMVVGKTLGEGTDEIDVEGDDVRLYTRFNANESQDFVIVHKNTLARGNITISVKDSRLIVNVQISDDVKVSAESDPGVVQKIIDAGVITISVTNPETGKTEEIDVIADYVHISNYEWPGDESSKDFEVNVYITLAGDATYQAHEAKKLTLTCTDTTPVYDIAWDADGGKYEDGTTQKTTHVSKDNTPTAPETPTREYYTFTGWDKTVVVATKDATYTATWKPTNDKNRNNNPDELDTFTIRFEYNGKVKEFTGKKLGDTVSFTPDAADAPAGQYFAGWDREVVAVKAEDAAAGTCVITYTATWDAKCTVTIVYGNGTADGSELIVPGGTINLANPTFDQHIFDGWYVNGVKVAMPYTVNNSVTVTAKWLVDLDRDNVEDGTVGDPYWTVTVDGTVVSTTTLNGEYATPADPADQENMFFVKWNKVVDSANHTITFTAVWNTNDSNDNNKDDASETITVTQTGGTVTVNGATANGNHVYDSTKTAHTIVITPAKNYYVKSLKINGTVFDIQPKSASVAYNNGVLTLSNVTLTNGMTIEVEYAEHKIPAVSEPSMKVNGHIDEKVASVTKKAVLEAILGKTLTDAEVAQYEVKMYVNLGTYDLDGPDINILPPITIDGYYDIWKLVGDYSPEINAAIKSALAKAIDVGGTESFDVTWLAHDKYPEVTQRVTVKLNEARTPTKVEHNGDTYTASSINDALLEEIKADLSSPNSTISQVVWADNSGVIFQAGATVTLKVTVTVLEDANVYGDTHTVTVTVNVPYTEASVVIPETGNLIYNTGMTDADKVAMVLQVLNPQITPELPAGMTPTVWYLASEARNVDMSINFGQMDLGIYSTIIKNLLGDSITIQIPVENMWLNIGDDLTIPEMPSNERIEWILMNDLIPNYGADFVSGQLSSDQMTTILANTLKKYPDIAEYYKYLGAHQFGEAEQEKVYVSVSDYGYGAATSNISVLNLTDTRAESEIKLNSGVEVTYKAYTEAELLALILDGVYANGQKIDGLTVEFVTDVIGLPAADASEVTVKFTGNKDYKPSTATIAIKINKATVNVSVDNRLFKWQEGQFYNINDVVSTNPTGVDTINFVAGLNLNGVNLDGGVKGFVAQVQLLLPDELQALLESANGLLQAAGLDISFADGASMKLSELKAAVDALDGIVAGSEYEEYFRVLLNMLSSLPTEIADIEIIIGGKMPTDIGAYVVGAISADANYTTDFGVGAVVIYPDGTKVDLAWNQNDENYVITNTLLSSGAFDTGAHAIKVYDDRFTLEQATEQVAEIFLGVDIDGNITLEMDQSKLNVGAYVEVAMIVQLGNEMFYSEPLVRPLVVIAETLDVDFVDASGAVNNERHYEFFNIPQNGMEGNLLVTYKKDGNGYKAGDKVNDYIVKYFYVGVQTNGVPYASQEAPVHAGVYTITAMVTVRDNTGYITHAGQGIGALVIEPSKSTIDVENEAIKWDGNEHTFNQYVTAGSVNVPTITPDTTVITAGINADLDANIGLSAINGTVNVDMPIWLDNLMKKLGILEAGYADGITVTEFKAYVEKIKTGLAELGFDSEAFDKIVSVIDQLDGNVVLTFHDNKGYKEVGVYLVIGIVTDSDHYPSADAGLVVIYPDATKVELQFNETWDDNNVFTWAYLQSYDLNAKAYQPGTNTEIPAATDKVINLFVGFADHGELEFTSNKTELDNGVYAQVAFVLDLSNEPYYAEPIAREVIIVPNNADIDFVDEDGKVNNDRHFGFNNEPHAMNTIRVTLVDGTVLNLTVEDSRVAIFYVGVQSNGQPYASYDAPVNTGVYEVTAQYTERDAQGRVIHLGVGIGALVIEASKSNVTVDNDAFPYGEAHKVNGLVHASSVNVPGLTPDTTIISAGLSANLDNISGLNAINGTVNIDLPAWMDSVMNELNILDAGYANGISAEVFLSYADKIRNGMDELGVDTVAFDKIVSLVKQLPISTNLTFTDDIAYSEIGAYLVIAVVTDFNHYPSVGAGVMVIYPNATKVDLKFNEDWNDNNIFTWHALKSMGLEAKAYLNGAYCEAADKKVVNLYFGFTDDGQFMLDAVTYGESIKDVPEFRNGMYTQLALVQDLGNEMYYAKPISRAFVIVPTPAIIEFVDGNGNVNADRHFVFNNKPQGMDVRVTIAGVEQTDLSGLTITYVGIQTNGVKYNSTVAPTHSGAYVVTATMTARDAQGRLVTLGVAVGAMVIEPAKSTVTVDSKLHEFNNTGVSTDAMIHTGSAVAGISPDKTVITASITSEGLQAIKGEVNVDFPAWVDTILNRYAPSIYGAGIPVGEFSEKVVAKLNKAVADAEALAEEYDIPADKLIATLTAAIAEVEKIVDQLPTGVILTFKEQSEVAPKEVGAYLVVAVVTDSDHYPSMDAGVLVIYPNVSKAELKWFYNDTNGIFTLPALKSIEMTANGYVGGVEDEAVTATIAYLTVGIDENGKLIVTSNPNSLTSNGAYTEVAYIPVKVGAEMTVAAPIMRSFVVVPQTVTVTVTDTESIFNEDYQVPTSVVDMNKQAITGERLEKYLELTYIGINASAGLYHSYVKPTSVGVYAVIATYIEKDANGEYTYVGMNVGKLTIKAASASVDVENEIHVFNDKKFDVTELITKNPADAKLAVITAALNLDGDFSKSGILATGTSVNIDFPTRVDEVLQKVLGDAYTNGIKLNPFFQKLDDISAELVEIGVDAKAVSYLKKQLEQLPSNTVLTFKDQVEVNPSAIGVYTIGAVVMDPDYQFAADAGLLVITNDITLAELKWNYRDTNSIITRAVLAELDMAASAYVKDAYNEENTNRISYMVFGTGSDGSISLISDPAAIKNLPNGVYTEVAYIYQEIDATMTLAIPVARTFTIVEHNVDVIFEDVEAIYNGQPHGVDVIIKDLNLNVIDDPKNLTVTYINLGTNYYSTTAPTEVGSYTVVVKYEKYINGDRAFFGMEVGNVTIKPADADYILSDKTVECGEISAINGMITNTNNLPYAIYIIKNAAKGEVNVILPAGWKVTLPVGAGVDALIAEIEKLPAVIENTKLISTLKSVLNSIDMQRLTVNGAQPSTCGEYDITAIAFGNKNYNIAKASATLTIEHADEEIIPGKNASCTDTGLTEGKKCAVCGDILVAQEVISATDHDWSVSYTWSADGKTCTATHVCGNNAAHNETATATVTSKVTDDPTCTEKGETTYTATFTEAWATTQTKVLKDVPATDHDWSVSYTWSADGKTCTATHVCGNNAAHNETVSAVITSKQTKDPTCTEKGETTYTATFEATWATKQTKTVADVPATDHDWSVSYTWSADGKTCTATHVCGNNAAHNETATATVTSKVTDDPTCTEKGETTYTATFTEAWATTQTKVLKDVPATDHDWSVSYTWSADGKTCTATHVCGNNAAHNETVSAVITSKQTKDPTCTEKGETTYTATFEATWATKQTKTVADVPATDHDWSVSYTWSADGKTCTATHVCGNNAAHNETATATVTSKVTDDPTCTEKGETTYTATFTEAWATTQTKVLKDVPATDHDWSVSYTWSADGKTCTATRTCAHSDDCEQTAAATVTSAVKTGAGCETKGTTTYTATFTADWATKQTKDVQDIPATGHIDINEDHKCDNCGISMGQIKDPVIGIPMLSGDNIYGFAVDYENKRIYIDTVKTGLTIDQFVEQLEVLLSNDADNKAEIVVSYQNKALTGTELIRTEAQVSLTAENDNGKITVKYGVVVIGDVNRNGEVDSGDASLIQRNFFKEVELTDLQADAADTNRSGEIESGDAVKNQVKYNDAANYQSNLHSYTEGTSNGDATCEKDGTMTLQCTANHNCGAKFITVPEAGSAKGHKYVLKEDVYVCEVCGKKQTPNV